MRTLLVTQATRSFGEWRRPWVRALYRRYVEAHRREVARAVARLAPAGELTVLAARELVDEAALPAGVHVRYYDEQSFRTDTTDLAALARQLERQAWPVPAHAPALRHRGIWLPEVLTFHRRLVLRFEVAEPFGAVKAVWDDAKPERLAVLSGASVPERIARLFARRDRLPSAILAPRFVLGRVYALAMRRLHSRDERARIRDFLRWPRRPAPAGPRGTSPRIVFVTCRPRQHLLVDPLLEALRAAGADCRVIAHGIPELRASVERLQRAGVPCHWINDYLPREEGRRLVRGLIRPLLATWRRVSRAPDFTPALDWEGVALAGVVRPFLRDQVELSPRAALVFQEAALRAVDALRPDAVVMTNVRRHAERAMALAARARAVPCLLFSNALVMVRERAELFGLGDRMLVMGDDLRQRMVAEQGVDPRRISVIGDPRSHAARLAPPERLRAEVLEAFRLPPGRPLLTIVSKYVSLLFSIQEKAAFYRTVFGARRRLGDPHVIVKVHPNEDLELLRRQVVEWGCPEAVLTRDHDIHRLFGASDAAVMVTSMAGLEAMAMGCPVIALQTDGKDFDGGGMPAYVSAGAVERVGLSLADPEASAGALAAALRPLLDDPAVRAERVAAGRAFAARHVHPVDGRLAERLLETVAEVKRELAARRRGAGPDG